ncbi:MAG: anti-sigma factor family protein, partial [bacterium]
MDCEKIEREEIVDRYLLGELSDEEQKLFEEHYFGCDRCFQELRETEMMMCGLEILDREGALVFEEGMEKRRFKWPAWLTWRPSPVVATAMALLIVVLVYPAWRGLVVLPELSSV